ncbi:hypothetical protein Taro_010033, partial [Colocasia esculenta]|nr:hypothetical protein [Colocasia esculenta]
MEAVFQYRTAAIGSVHPELDPHPLIRARREANGNLQFGAKPEARAPSSPAGAPSRRPCTLPLHFSALLISILTDPWVLMADDDGYHPPQFSEVSSGLRSSLYETAWLPPWLRSSQLLLSDDGRKKGDQHVHPVGCQILEADKGNVDDGQGTDGIGMEDSRCFSCHLHLSGGDSSSDLGVHSSENVPHFHLHLSSEGISQISLGGLSYMHEIGSFKSNRQVPGPELSAFQHEVDYVHNIRNENRLANISVGRYPHPKGQNQGSRKKNKEKVDRHLKTIDIHDAVELTIAASEALVISELTITVSDSELFNTAALLEVALRVKQARNDCSVDTSKAVSSSSTDEHDETDQLDDLDDYIMADAFEDVGLLYNQNTTAPNDTSDGNASRTIPQKNVGQREFLRADDIYVSNTRLSEVHGCIVAQEKVRTQDLDISVIALQKKPNHASTVDSKLKQMSLQACLLSHMEPSVHFLRNLDIMDTSNIKGQVRESMRSIHKNGNDSTLAGTLSKEDRTIQGKDGEDILHRDKKLRGGIPDLFHGETSFISESMDVPKDGNAIVTTPEAEPKKIASLSSLFEDNHRIPCDENRKNTDEEIVASCDLMEMDTLCSVVPCSLAGNNHVPDRQNQEGIGTEGGWCLKPTAELIGIQNAEGSLPIVVDTQRRIFFASNNRDEGSMVTHKLSSSLRNYSVLVPARSTFSSGQSFLLRDSVPTVSIDENRYRMASREETAKMLMEPTTNSQNINEQRHNLENHDKTCRPSETAESIVACMEQFLKHKETLNNDVSHNHQHAGTSVPIILNTGSRRRIQACETIPLTKDKALSPKISLLPEMERSRKGKSSDECHCRDKSCVSAASSPHPSFHTHFIEECHMPTKKVRFSEAQTMIHHLPASMSEEQSSPTMKHGSSEAEGSHATKTNRKMKDSSKTSKFVTRKSKYKCLSKDLNKDGKRHMLDGQEFLLTGFSRKKKGEVQTLIRRHGGLVLPDIPSPSFSLEYTDQHLPIVLSPKKVQTTKFLYGCAVKTWLLHDNWLSDSVQAGFMLPPAKYLTLPNQISERKHFRIGQLHVCNSDSIFDKVGVMLFGKISFCARFTKVIKV